MEPPQLENDSNSLEGPETVVDNTPVSPAPNSPKKPEEKDSFFKKITLNKRIQGLISHVNVYLLLFIFFLVLAGIIGFVGYSRDKKSSTDLVGSTHELTAEELSKIAASSSKVGDPRQTLSIESNAVFSGKVLLKSDLDVAGSIRVGNSLNLPGITVSGNSNFDQIIVNQLTIAGGASVQGTLAVQDNLTVSGGATFGGTISAPRLDITNLQINGDLQINRHVDAGGGTPSKSNGNALGSGGTASNNGTDTAGTITINTGSSPSSGCFATLTFANAFKDVPHVVVTPVGSAAAGLNYYITRTTSNFSVCTTNAAPASSSFSFDYMAFD